MHWSPVVAGLPSSQAVPSVTGALAHVPAGSWHTPALHWSVSAVQSWAEPGAQLPAPSQWSLTVHPKPSLQLVMLDFGTATHMS